MANELVLMERGFDSMNVPGEKVTEYLAAGWKEISRKPREAGVEKKPKAATPKAEKPKGKTG
jgi:hypothetical protein